MSRALSVAMTSYLAGPMLALCNCCLVTRRDGLAFGFTSLDADLVFSGITYEAASAVDASELRQSIGSGVDNLDIVSLLVSARITETDLRAGLWDGAAVELFQAVFDNTALGRITLLSGYFGEVTHSEGQYRAEVRSLSQRLSQQIGDLTATTCRVRRLFDAQCMPKGYNENGVVDNTVTPAMHRFVAPVDSVTSLFVMTFTGPTTPVGGEAKASGYYDYSQVHFNTGLNAGLEREVKSHVLSGGKAVLTLQEPFPFAVAVADTAALEAGCNRTFAQCRTKFFNAWNHRGEPHLPGNEAILLRRGKR